MEWFMKFAIEYNSLHLQFLDSNLNKEDNDLKSILFVSYKEIKLITILRKMKIKLLMISSWYQKKNSTDINKH